MHYIRLINAFVIKFIADEGMEIVLSPNCLETLPAFASIEIDLFYSYLKKKIYVN